MHCLFPFLINCFVDFSWSKEGGHCLWDCLCFVQSWPALSPALIVDSFGYLFVQLFFTIILSLCMLMTTVLYMVDTIILWEMETECSWYEKTVNIAINTNNPLLLLLLLTSWYVLCKGMIVCLMYWCHGKIVLIIVIITRKNYCDDILLIDCCYM